MAIVENRHWILLALLTAAAASYGVGFMVGFGLLVAAGVIFELAFWLELFWVRHNSQLQRFMRRRTAADLRRLGTMSKRPSPSRRHQ